MQKSRLLMRERVGSRDETKATEGVSRRGGGGGGGVLDTPTFCFSATYY